MTRVVFKGIAMGAFAGFLLFELLTGLVFFYGLGSGHGVNVAGAFVVTMQPNGGFLLSVTPTYLIGLAAIVVAFAVVVTGVLLRSRSAEVARSREA